LLINVNESVDNFIDSTGFHSNFWHIFEVKSVKMRQRFEQQTIMGIMPINEVRFSLRSRDELPPVLKALQYIFITPELNEQIFALLENKICKGKKKTGRKGMDLWHILVLAVVRHALDTNWDRITYVANYDALVRQVMGVQSNDWGIEQIEFAYQTIIDNVSLVDENILQQINQIVVSLGHDLLKKKEEEGLELKTDSYAVQTNVHFPTDLNLLWDSLRKSFDMVEALVGQQEIEGWRKIKLLKRQTKSLFRNASQQVFRGGYKNPEKKLKSVKDYLGQAKKLNKRFEEIQINQFNTTSLAIILGLESYQKYTVKLIDQVDRRLIKGEIIEASEKIFSIFEPHTEWISKGKLHPNVELGKLLLITTDQFQFIVDYKVMAFEKDPSQVEPLCQRIKIKFPQKKILSHSFDKGFYSKDNYNTVKEKLTSKVIMPKRGRKNKEEQEREAHREFKKLRNKHSAVESNINMLEHHGLNRCPDKGLQGLKQYVGFCVLAYNLHILGNHLMASKTNKNILSKAA
jgi:transposase, IS5 family